MKIAVITDQFPPRVGGMSTHAYYISHYLSKNHEVLVIKEKNPTKDYSNEPFKVVDGITRRFPTLDLFFLLNILRKFKPNVIHVCTAGLNYVALTKKYPVVTRVVGNDFLRPWAGFNLPFRFLIYRIPNKMFINQYRIFETKIRKKIVVYRLKQNTLNIANSKWTKEHLLRLNIKPQNIKVISGGVDINRFYPSKDVNALRKKMNIPTNKIILLTVSNLIAIKNIDAVIKTIPFIKKHVQDIFYIVVGDGKLKKQLLNLAKELNVLDNVQFTGEKNYPELVYYYQACDIYIQPSKELHRGYNYSEVETMGRSYIEASSCGKPVIGSFSGGIPSVVKDGKTGILLRNPLDEIEIAAAILKLAKDEKLRKMLGNNGYEFVHSGFSWEKVGEKFENEMIKNGNHN